MPSVEQILKTLRGWGSKENLAGMARYGISVQNACGVPLRKLRPYAKELGRDHARALTLWETGNREARLLAIFTADPKLLTRAQMDAWARDFASWDICDGAASHLFRKSPFAWDRALRWTKSSREFVRRAGFAMIAALAVHDKKAPDETFLEVLPLIETAATDERNFVKKAVNWALRQIGKRNPALRPAAIQTAERLAHADSASSRWIGRDALRELSALENRSRSSRPSGTPSKRIAPGTLGRSKTPTRRRGPG